MDYGKVLDLKDIVYFCEDDLIWKTEQWKDVPGYIGYYTISDLGRIKSLERIVLNKGKYPVIIKSLIMKTIINKQGYRQIRFIVSGKRTSKRVHQLVAMAFLDHVPCGMELVVNHKNLIKTDNRAINFEIITQRENSNRKHIKSSSQYVGVRPGKTLNKWLARIRINNKENHLGTFDSEIEAHEAYQTALSKL